jgi:predicted NBD/HSP70 family sugar kinase
MNTEYGSNIEDIKASNRELILSTIKKHGPISRKDISEKLNLTKAAITKLTNEMIEQNILVEKGQFCEPEIRAGRKKVLIDINWNYKYAIGVSVEYDYTSVGVCNINGETVALKRVLTDRSLFPEAFLTKLAGEIREILWTNSISRDELVGLGITFIGAVDHKNGVVKKEFGLWDREIDVRTFLEKELQIKVVVNNNVRALALAEIDYGSANGNQNILFIRHGFGIGAAMILNGNVYYGAHNASAEIGHFVVDYNGAKCRCGKKGCLETLSSQSSMVNRIRDLFSQDKTPILYRECNGDRNNINFDIILSLAESEPLILELLTESAAMLGKYISLAVQMIDPEKIILHGVFFNNTNFYNIFLEEFKKNADKHSEESILISKINTKKSYFGGIAIVLKKFFYDNGGLI